MSTTKRAAAPERKKQRRPPSVEWTAREMKLLARLYPTTPLHQLRERYFPHRSKVALVVRAQLLGVRQRSRGRPWSDDELAAVRRLYERTGGLKQLSRDLNRTKHQIESKANALGLRRERDSRWTAQEDAKLGHLYPKFGLLAPPMPNRSRESMAARACKLGLHVAKTTGDGRRGPPWTDAERAILKRRLRSHELVPLLPSRSDHAIKVMRQRLGLNCLGKRLDSLAATGTVRTAAKR